MKVETGRVYMLLDDNSAFMRRSEKNKPLLVKVIDASDLLMESNVLVVGFLKEGDTPLDQYVSIKGLKPASEKQRVAFNREYYKVVREFKEKGRPMLWL